MFEFILQLLASALKKGSVCALVAMGLVITIRSTEVLFFTQGTLAMMDGLSIYVFFGQIQLPLVISISVSLFFCVAVAVITRWTVILPLLKRGAPFNVSIITIGDS